MELTARAGSRAETRSAALGVAAATAGAPPTPLLLRATGPPDRSPAVRAAPRRRPAILLSRPRRPDRPRPPWGYVSRSGLPDGLRLLQVSRRRPYAASCGADCPGKLCPVSVSSVVSVTEYCWGLGPAPATAPSCAESYYPDGSVVETRIARPPRPPPPSAPSVPRRKKKKKKVARSLYNRPARRGPHRARSASPAPRSVPESAGRRSR